jgi:hypothetical protein
MGTFELDNRDRTLLEETNSRHYLTKILPVYSRENTIEQRWTVPKDVNEELPSLIPTGDLLRGVSGWAVERSG